MRDAAAFKIVISRFLCRLLSDGGNGMLNVASNVYGVPEAGMSNIGVPLACFAAVAVCYFLLLPTFKLVCGEWRKMQVAAARGAFLPACFPPSPSPSSFGEEDKKT